MNTATRAVPALVPLANGLGVTRLFAAGFPQGQGKERKGKAGGNKKSRRKRGKEGGPHGGGNAFARRNDRFSEWTDGFVILERKFSR